MFITDTDIQKAMKRIDLNAITRNDPAIIQFAIDAAISEMKSYLVDRFDTDTIFAALNTDRHPLLVIFAADIAIYNFIENDIPGIDHKDRLARYQRAIDWLKQVQKGNIMPDLPATETQNAQAGGSYLILPKRPTHF